MSEQLEQQVPQEQPKKEERIDELDVMGGLLIRFFQKIINSFRNKKNSSQ